MRRIAFHMVVTLITFVVGVYFASGWNSLRGTAVSGRSALDFQKGPRSAAEVSGSSTEEELQAIYRQYAVAQTNHDGAFFEQIEREDFILFGSADRNLTRTEDIELMKTLDPDIKYTNDSLDIQLYGDAAVVAGQTTATFRDGIRDSWRWIDVCVRRNGRWQILSTTQVN